MEEDILFVVYVSEIPTYTLGKFAPFRHLEIAVGMLFDEIYSVW